MKKYFYLIASVLFFSIHFSQAQTQIKRCGTYETLKKQMDADASYKAKYENYQQSMREWSAQRSQERLAGTPEAASSTILIPVVIHVVYKNSDENISNDQVNSELDVLNADYSGSNADQSQIPSPFKSLFGNVNLHFALATKTPSGTLTNGIERRQTSVDSFAWGDPAVKYYSSGGLDAWDRSKYLNIWVCHLDYGLLGWSTLPPPLPPAAEDGSVVHYKAFGTTGNLYAPWYSLGRTCTHEVGHWLGLVHIWGDDNGLCPNNGGKDDNMADTPPQADATTDCPAWPKTDACSTTSPGIMFMNYMDYSYDYCMHMFTADQAAWMQHVLNTLRSSILTSDGASPPTGFAEINSAAYMDVFPNPAQENLHINLRFPTAVVLNVTAYDMVGKEMYSTILNKSGRQSLDINASALNAGLYMLVVNTDQGKVVKRFTVIH